MSEESPTPHRRRPRYVGKYPRRFEEKYKELDPGKYPETISRVLASGKTPAGMHVPIMVREVLEVLAPRPGDYVIDCTLGHGGHALELLAAIQPGGRLLGLDVDPFEQPRTEARLRALGHGPAVFTTRRVNFAALPRIVAESGPADCLFADLGVSSMQIDTPSRGFSVKIPGPLDMRMNPSKGLSASEFLVRLSPGELAALLRENADEPRADVLASQLAGRRFSLTTDLSDAIRTSLPKLPEEERDKSVRRVFQALRIAVNDEFGALDTLLRHLPGCLAPGGRAAILTFHSGEDRRVKASFETALMEGSYSAISFTVIRAGAEETGRNPRATSAKLRWARR